jgi:hypothetical protein
MHAPTEDKIDGMKVGFYKEGECVLDQFSKYYINILLGNFNSNIRREGIFK